MKALEEEIAYIKKTFQNALYVDFNLISINPIIKTWYLLSWNRFQYELLKEKADINTCRHRNWRTYFYKEKQKMLLLLERLNIEIEK